MHVQGAVQGGEVGNVRKLYNALGGLRFVILYGFSMYRTVQKNFKKGSKI